MLVRGAAAVASALAVVLLTLAIPSMSSTSSPAPTTPAGGLGDSGTTYGTACASTLVTFTFYVAGGSTSGIDFAGTFYAIGGSGSVPVGCGQSHSVSFWYPAAGVGFAQWATTASARFLLPGANNTIFYPVTGGAVEAVLNYLSAPFGTGASAPGAYVFSSPSSVTATEAYFTIPSFTYTSSLSGRDQIAFVLSLGNFVVPNGECAWQVWLLANVSSSRSVAYTAWWVAWNAGFIAGPIIFSNPSAFNGQILPGDQMIIEVQDLGRQSCHKGSVDMDFLVSDSRTSSTAYANTAVCGAPADTSIVWWGAENPTFCNINGTAIACGPAPIFTSSPVSKVIVFNPSTLTWVSPVGPFMTLDDWNLGSPSNLVVFPRNLANAGAAASFDLDSTGTNSASGSFSGNAIGTTAVSFSKYANGAGATIAGSATVYQNPTTGSVQVVLVRQSGASFAIQANGASGASCSNPYNSATGLLIAEVHTSNGGHVNLAEYPSMNYLSGNSAWCSQSDAVDLGYEYVQGCFAGTTATQVDVAAVWSSIPYDAGLYLTGIAGNPSVSGGAGVAAQSFTLIPSVVQGTVTDSSTAAAISGASVVVSNAQRSYRTTSGTNGAYSIGNVYADTYTVTVTGSCVYERLSGTVTTQPGQTTRFNAPLVKHPLAALSGYVYGGSTSNPLSGASVVDTCSGLTTTSSSIGQYDLRIEGDRSVTVTASGPCAHTPQSVTVNMVDGTTQSYNFILPAWPLGALSGYVVDLSTGLGIAGATVRDACGGRSTSTNSSGFYSFSVVSGKSISVSASATGYQGLTLSVTVPSGGSATLNFNLGVKSSGGGGCTTPPCPTAITPVAPSPSTQPWSPLVTAWWQLSVDQPWDLTQRIDETQVQ